MEMDLSDPVEIIVLVRQRGGRQHAWLVEDPVRASFEIIDQNGHRPVATLTATGKFRRQSRAGEPDLAGLETDIKELPHGRQAHPD